MSCIQTTKWSREVLEETHLHTLLRLTMNTSDRSNRHNSSLLSCSFNSDFPSDNWSISGRVCHSKPTPRMPPLGPKGQGFFPRLLYFVWHTSMSLCLGLQCFLFKGGDFNTEISQFGIYLCFKPLPCCFVLIIPCWWRRGLALAMFLKVPAPGVFFVKNWKLEGKLAVFSPLQNDEQQENVNTISMLQFLWLHQIELIFPKFILHLPVSPLLSTSFSRKSLISPL